jgi:heterodisulfide reductase subunit C
MADTKVKQMSVSVAKDPSLMTGAIPTKDWMDVPAVFKPGNYCYPGKKDIVAYHDKNLPGLFGEPREWKPEDEDWKLPENWKEIIIQGMKDRLDKFRSFKIFMDCCVRCGACADKCHFFLGTGDPKNMPVLRAELLRSVYRNDFTKAGKILGKIGRLAGAREMTFGVLKEWFMYFYQCTECRRCSVFCPYGIDTAEVTMMARELLHLVGVNTNWILEPAANSNKTGNHLGLQPHTFKQNAEFLLDDIEEVTGLRMNGLNFNRKGAEVLFVIPSADVFAEPGIYTFMGYLLLFEHIGLDYTISTYASEGGNFGLFTNNELDEETQRQDVRRGQATWGQVDPGRRVRPHVAGHHQYMDTMNGPADFLEMPTSPITGTVFENAASTKMVHISEFTADLDQEQ